MSSRALQMTWVDLAFLHWPVRAERLRPMIPIHLDIDVHGDDGMAWIGVVPFEMRGVRIRGLPSIPTATNFPELNVRTYVTHKGHPGVWFFSLDAESWLAVVGARAATGLPYHHADMKVSLGSDGSVSYESLRTNMLPEARFHATYKPHGNVFRATPGTFEHWCTQRLTLYSQHQMRTLLRLDIEHEPWPLQRATVEIATNTMAQASNIQLPGAPPHALFAKQLDVVAHLPTPV